MTKLKWPDLTRTAVALEKFDIWEAGEGQRLFDNAMTNDAVDVVTAEQRKQEKIVAEALYLDTANINNVGIVDVVDMRYIRQCVFSWLRQKKHK